MPFKGDVKLRLPKIKIGEGELERAYQVGSVRKASNAIAYDRKNRLRRGQLDIVGIPTAWIRCLVDRTGLFSVSERNSIKQFWADGSAQAIDLDAIHNFPLHDRLERVNMGRLRDAARIIKISQEKMEVNYDIEEGQDKFTFEELGRLFSSDFGVVLDCVCKFIHVKDDVKGVNVLWQKFSKRKEPITKVWGNYGVKINELHKKHYGKLKTTSHLDVVAIHEDDDWFLHNFKIKEAIDKAYDPVYVKSVLEPMMGTTDARGVLQERREFPRIPRKPTIVKPLFPGMPSYQRKFS